MSNAVFATIRVKPEHMDAACAAVGAIVIPIRGDDGCVVFEPGRAAGGSATMMIFEEWADRAAFDLHHSQDDTKHVFARYEDWLRRAPELVEAEPLKG